MAHSGISCSERNEVVCLPEVKISILKYGKYIDTLHCKSYSQFCSTPFNVFKNTLAATVNKFVIKELV